MKVAIIPPLGGVSLAEGDYHLILPQYIDSYKRSHYKLFYQETEGYKILDNGAAEGKLASNERLMEVACEIAADDIVVPDILGDAGASFRLAMDFAPIAKDYDWFNYIGVVQGRDRAEIVQSIHLLMDVEYIKILAVPRHLCQKVHKYIRYDIVEALYEEIKDRFYSIHFLGSSAWAKEPVVLSDLPMARGIDTSFPVYMGMEGLKLGVDAWTPRPRKYFKEALTPEGERLARENIDRYRMWAA